MSLVARIRSLLVSGIEKLAVLVFVAMMLAMVAQVFFRYVLGLPLTWVEELARFLFIWMVYLGAIVSLERGLLHRVDLLRDRLRGWQRRLLMMTVEILEVICVMAVLESAIQVFRRFARVRSVALEIPWRYVYLSVLVFVLAILILTLLRFLDRLGGGLPRSRDRRGDA